MPPTPGSDRAQASYEQQGGYSSGHEPLYDDYSSSILAKKSTRASRVGFDLFKDCGTVLMSSIGVLQLPSAQNQMR